MEPPKLGEAVNVNAVPAHVVFEPLIVNDGVTVGVTTIVNVFEEAVVGLAHDELDVKLQVIVCPLVNVIGPYDALLVPTGEPSNCHWYTGVEPPP